MNEKKYNNEGTIDQLIVRVGKACNFKCNFCNVTDNERNVKLIESINDIVRNFHYKVKYSKFKNDKIVVAISGGEPSIFSQETLFALKYIKSYFEKRGITASFEIQTNGANISYGFAQKLKKYGVDHSLVSFHTNDEDLFNEIIGVDYNEYYYKIIEGINNLHKAGIIVLTNTILNNINKNNFYSTIVFLEKEFPFITHFNIGLIQPHGEALKNLKEVYPKYNEVQKEYNRALFYLSNKGNKVTSHFVGLPACYIGHFKESLEVSTNTLFRREFDFTDKYLINKINDKNKTQIKECNNCLYNNVCSGIWTKYIGLQKLNPINYIRDFSYKFKINNFCYKLNDINEPLKKIYDKNIRQIIIPSGIGNKNDIINILKRATVMGFYKITLLVDNNFILENDILNTGVSNVQVNINNISLKFINDLLKFSERFTPQFRIDLDIFIDTFGIEEFNKIKELFNIIDNSFLKFYFIYNGGNPEINKFKPLFNFGYDNVYYKII